MQKSDIVNDPLMQDWYNTTLPAPKTWQSNTNAMWNYCKFLNLLPHQLIEEAEEDVTMLPRMRRIRQKLGSYHAHLSSQGLADKTILRYVSVVSSFYRSFDIDVPKVMKNRKAMPMKENMEIITVEELQAVYEQANVLERAVILSGYSSGMSASDLSFLKIHDFKKGYDPDTGICMLNLRRGKVNYDHISFFSPEASQAILTYLSWRDSPPISDHEDHVNAAFKRKVREDDGYLFVQPHITEKYMDSLDEDLRQMTAKNIMEMYKRLSVSTGMECEGWSKLRSHNIRKMFFTNLINAGCDSKIADYWMGHNVGSNWTAYYRGVPEQMKDIYIRYISAVTLRQSVDVESSEQYKDMESKLATTSDHLERSRMMSEWAVQSKLEQENRLSNVEKALADIREYIRAESIVKKIK